ncbi:unnamed protein product [Rotaria magnacalcarata]|uniref:Uncharacterized protein n=1 Tax=Rotaria magnacalcarata TaxID=392030 RepID=A0A816X7X8_9BILA|nr:unnamed protein product [Rotaria magnacalcarata]CAF1410898.1 unnamed protein product [Rotaria magnacalcarata]CAF2077868.1 unnamed protein product [Rotaria magnacalcarata]CAF2119269.1 unnamed protein product [Rotaria magnacalcarata]CAF2143680.1 unnamed protein product [Rotaria magnacalcarata]
MTRQRNLTSRKTKRLTILHFWNNVERSSTTISLITKIPLRTIKNNILKIKQQDTIEDRPRSGRPRKLTINDSKALSPWIRHNNKITGRETAPESKGGCVPMDNTTSALTNGLQKYFTLCNANVNRKTETSNSLDVNPIKNLWSIIKRRVEKRRPTDLKELGQFLHEE